jgi:hypothetical protein
MSESSIAELRVRRGAGDSPPGPSGTLYETRTMFGRPPTTREPFLPGRRRRRGHSAPRRQGGIRFRARCPARRSSTASPSPVRRPTGRNSSRWSRPPAAGKHRARHDHAGGCGGCSLLHATRAAAADVKRQLVRDAVGARGRRRRRPRGALASLPGPDLGYRNHGRVSPSTAAGDSASSSAGGTNPESGTRSSRSRHARRRTRASSNCVPPLEGRVRGAEEVEVRAAVGTPKHSPPSSTDSNVCRKASTPSRFPGRFRSGPVAV